MKNWIFQLRVHQWLKNLLVLVPLVLAWDTSGLLKVVAGIASFCLASSAVYVLNDIVDLEADRIHPQKKNRPIAAGVISKNAGYFASALLLVVAFAIASQVNIAFLICLLIYLMATSFYTFFGKHLAYIDVLMLAGLYTLRIVSGALAGGYLISSWLLLFSYFTFLSLALAKRFGEMHQNKALGGSIVSSRMYGVEEATLILGAGLGSAFVCILTFALYLNQPEIVQRYSAGALLWVTLPVIIYFYLNLWANAARGTLTYDPVIFALRNRASQASMTVISLLLVLAHIVKFDWLVG